MEKKVCDEIGNTPRKEHNIPKCETRQIPKIPAQDRVSCSLGKLVCPESRATYRSTAIFLFPTLGISRRGTRAPRNLTDLLSRLFIFETKRHGVVIIIAMDGEFTVAKPSQSDRLIRISPDRENARQRRNSRTELRGGHRFRIFPG